MTIFISVLPVVMACLGRSCLVLIMRFFILKMYQNRKNIAIILIIGDILYMKGMISHHSIAILTSKNADIKNPEVRKLADGIIKAQGKEIPEMKRYIERLEAEE